MRLAIDFTALELIAARFRSDRKFELDAMADMPWEPVDIALQSGVEISSDELEVTDGLLSYKGRHIILYIRDHGRNVLQALEDPTSGRKFHLAHCETLAQMRAEGRFDRYVVTQAVSGEYEISGVDAVSRREITGLARLQVCLNCLKFLNYKSFLLSSRQERHKTRDDFELVEFFETYSTRFKHIPSGLAGKKGASAYANDWAEISQALRAAANYTCEDCGVCLVEHRPLLHVHHVNGVKNDNRRENLQVLCKDCHRKQPQHQHIFMKAGEMALILRLRREQRRTERTWNSVLRHVDLAVRPLLEIAERRGWDAPELGIEVERGEGVPFDAAWPERRLAVSSTIAERDAAGWTIARPGKLLTELASGL